ncbi:hypothetical protein GCM10011348_15010 [Marinobacterium nitratireducens]|uniref:Uncharacterized protein n=1 Tax=Marinobacterium nitratireducens TaxID=518897 RepID=A0A918DR89_9GAMM|nr:hypothetical protein GCM10011348_15010 [Marinobacterium nitratireducens]
MGSRSSISTRGQSAAGESSGGQQAPEALVIEVFGSHRIEADILPGTAIKTDGPANGTATHKATDQFVQFHGGILRLGPGVRTPVPAAAVPWPGIR